MILLTCGLAFVAGSSLTWLMDTSESDQPGSSDAHITCRLDRYFAPTAGIAR
jgi:hypothetical protein